MDANQNPPSERDWTPQEMEEFFASQDAVTGLPNGSLAGAWARNSSPSVDNPQITLASIQKTMAEYDAKYDRPNIAVPSGIHLTSIVPPEHGWPIVAHCDLCKKTVIVLSPWAIKPEDGDYWEMHHTCLDEDLHIKHNMWPQKWYPWKEKKYTPQVYDPMPPQDLPSMVEFTQEMPIEEANKRWPDTPVTGEEKDNGRT